MCILYKKKEKMLKTTTREEGADRIYYNMSLTNNNLYSIPATFNANLPTPILKNPRDYFLSIVRFNLDGSSLPIFIFPDPAVTPLKVTLVLGAATSTVSVVYGFVNPEPSPGYGNVVYSYTAFIFMINQALSTAYTNVLGAGTAPYLQFNPNNGYVSLFAGSDFEGAVVGNANQIWFNAALYYYFDNVPCAQFQGEGRPDFKDVQLPVFDIQGSNTHTADPSIPVGLWKMLFETQALYRWQDLSTIQFQSNLIPVRQEYTTGVNKSMTTYNAGDAGTGAPSVPILTDFIPIDTDTNLIREDLTYYPTGEYRLTDLLDSSNGLANLDLQIYWTDKQNRVYQYLIPPQQATTLKLLFIKKDSYLHKSARNIL